MKEYTVEHNIIHQVKARGGVCWKWVSPGRRGVPDRICIFPGPVIVFVELKRPELRDGRSAQQKKVAEILERLGCQVWRIGDPDAFREKLNALGLPKVECHGV